MLSSSLLLAQRDLKIVGFSNYPLYFADEKGKIKGFYVDLIEQIAKEANWKISYELTNIPQCFLRIKNNQAQIGAIFSYSKERAKAAKFSRQSVMTLWGQTFVPIGSPVDKILHLNNKKIGFLNKGINYVNFSDMASNLQIQYKAVFYSTYEKMAKALENEEIDAAVFNNLTGDYLKELYDIKATGIVFDPFSLFFILPPDNPDSEKIITILDKKIDAWKSQKNSFYYQSLKKWYSAMAKQDNIKMGHIYSLIASLTLATIILFLMLRYARYEVKRQTHKINESNTRLLKEIEERKIAQTRALAERERYRVVTEATSDFVLRYDRNFRHIFVNRPTLESLGIKEKDILNKRGREMGFFPEDCEVMEKNLTQVFETGKGLNFELNADFADKTLVLDITLSPEISEDGTVKTVVGIARDISYKKELEHKNKELEEKMMRTQRLEAIGTLAGGIAHDFNNILAPVIGYAEILKSDFDSNSSVYESADEIYKAAIRGKQLVRQILAYSRMPESGMELVSLQSVIEESLKLIRPVLPSSIDIIKDIDSDCLLIVAESSQIHQVFMNLITNSFYAMKENGGQLEIILKQIELNTENEFTLEPGFYAFLKISDNGKGMRKETLEHIFEPYYTTKPQEEGTGLGLFQVHSIIKKLNGTIVVNSEEGGGTEFKILIPCARETIREIEEICENEQSRLKDALTIMLVDDEVMIIKLFEKLLKKLDYQVISFSSSVAALDYFKNNSNLIDAVITDMTMPDLTGDRLTVKLLEIKPEIPVIICTGYSENISPEKAEELGAKSLMVKPVTLKEITEKLGKILH
jgi:PAS domain S-box-containing protein